MRNLLLALIVICLPMLAGCPGTLAGVQLDESVGVEPGENALMCARLDVDPVWSESSASYRRAEIPSSVNLKELTPEQIKALYDC